MADIINLRQARKVRARTDAEAQASSNRHFFGRTKAEKTAAAIEAARRDKALDDAKRDQP